MKLIVIRQVTRKRLNIAYYSIPENEGSSITFEEAICGRGRHIISLIPGSIYNFIEAYTFNRHRRFKRVWSRGNAIDFDPLSEVEPAISLVLVRIQGLYNWDFWDEENNNFISQCFYQMNSQTHISVNVSRELYAAYQSHQETLFNSVSLQCIWN